MAFSTTLNFYFNLKIKKLMNWPSKIEWIGRRRKESSSKKFV